ncbi:MAG: N-acetylmuramoyl-L-alanine amidase [Deltaproteobacteria bacterium]|nr:N-acetylmuramoyl-L-alanine amidase [Deltaproteobacteria bacterium]
MTRNLSTIDLLIIHHSKTPDESNRWGAEDIDDWHRQRGFRRSGRMAELHQPHLQYIGYHGVILRTGELVPGRSLAEVGAHAEGVNGRSVGVCLVGTERFTPKQWKTLALVVYAFGMVTGGAEVIGHRDHDPTKLCPGFDVKAWLGRDLLPPDYPPEGHLYLPPR